MALNAILDSKLCNCTTALIIEINITIHLMFQIFSGFIAFVFTLDLKFCSVQGGHLGIQHGRHRKFKMMILLHSLTPKYGSRHWNHIYFCLNFEVIGKICQIWRPFWNSRWWSYRCHLPVCQVS